MTENLQATFEARRSGSNLVRLSGALDEHSSLDALLQSVKPGRLAVHLGGVRQFNDAGMRAWVAWLATLDARGVKVDLVACSPQIVDAFNADAQLARCATVKSVQAVYRCAKCNREDIYVVSIADVQQAEGAPQRACESCIGRLAMVEDPTRYFEFVAQLPRRSTSNDSSLTIATGSASDIARDSVRNMPSRPMLSLRPSAYSVLQTVMTKHTSPTTTANDRKYVVAFVLALALVVCASAALLLL